MKMALHLHHLYGCSPQPLALYLKAIGILCLVAEQVDPDARGWWQDGRALKRRGNRSQKFA